MYFDAVVEEVEKNLTMSFEIARLSSYIMPFDKINILLLFRPFASEVLGLISKKLLFPFIIFRGNVSRPKMPVNACTKLHKVVASY